MVNKVAKYNMILQTRRYRFAIIIFLAIFFGFMCVPANGSGYEIFYLSGVRGIYNSHWLGAMASLLGVILLWLPGFFLLRNVITDDETYKVNEFIATSPISNLAYIFGKFLSNITTLVILKLIFLASIMAMQFIRGESTNFSLMAYLTPFLTISLPYLIILSAFTIFFDVVPFLKGFLGNFIIIGIWTTISVISVALDNFFLDIFNIGFTINQMMDKAQIAFPNIDTDSGSFGYYPVQGLTKTFEWSGYTWDKSFIINKLIWIGVSLLIVFLSSIIYKRNGINKIKSKGNVELPQENKRIRHNLNLIRIKKSSIPLIISIAIAEFKMIIRKTSMWWWISILCVWAGAMFIPYEQIFLMTLTAIFLAVYLSSQIAVNASYYSVDEIIFSSASKMDMWWGQFISVFVFIMLATILPFTRIILNGDMPYVMSHLIAVLFTTSLNMFLGMTTKTRKTFEGVFIIISYFGPLNGIEIFDYMSINTNNTILYLLISLIILLAGSIIVSIDFKKNEIKRL